MHRARIESLNHSLRQLNLVGLALLPGPSLKYLIGLDLHLLERPIIGLFPTGGKPVLIVPDLDREKADQRSELVKVYSYPEETGAREEVIRRAVSDANLQHGQLGVEPLSMRFQEQQLLLSAASELHLVPAEEAVMRLRITKSESEIKCMAKAAEIAESAIERALPAVRVGMSELQLANRIVVELLEAGSEPELPFHPIVASGPNSAMPHAGAGSRVLQQGDMLLIDWGASFGGYMSDITRMFCLGPPDEEMERAYSAVLAANGAGRAAVAAGTTCAAVDAAARDVLEGQELGRYFVHRTGHGLGMEAHEPPSVQSDNLQELAPGMAFTVEPGVYLPGKWGIRIEDNVVVTPNGARTLTSIDRNLRILT